MSETDEKTGLPKEISLSDALGRIKLAPHEISTLIGEWGQRHQGTASVDLSRKLAEGAAGVVDPETYKSAKTTDFASDKSSQPIRPIRSNTSDLEHQASDNRQYAPIQTPDDRPYQQPVTPGAPQYQQSVTPGNPLAPSSAPDESRAV